MAPYQNGEAVFGEKVPVDFLIDRIKQCEWRTSLVRLARISAILANDEAGPTSRRALHLTKTAINQLTASTPEGQAMLQRGRQYVANSSEAIIVAHEEALVFLEHLVVLYGGDGADGPTDAELSLWLLGASDHLDEWKEEDGRVLSDTEKSAAELVKTFRYNRSSVDEMRLHLRASVLFATPPENGPFNASNRWVELQHVAFGDTFERYFEAFALPLNLLSKTWGRAATDNPPVLSFDTMRKAFGTDGSFFVDRLRELTATRGELQVEIRKRMRVGDVLPHAPTALLRKPFVDLENGEVVAASPWYVWLLFRTGIWARYLDAAKTLIGDAKRGGDEWTVAFGQMLEQWCRDYAKRAEHAAGSSAFRIELPTRPGAEDEIDDVVAVEPDAVAMFSVKARFVREDIARHALSRSKLLEWYEDYFFKEKSAKYRKGVIGQLSDRIDLVRTGKFEPRVRKTVRVFPVLVTFDDLCANSFLYEWLTERCRQHSLLQQDGVAPLTIAVVDDYERLIGAPVHGKSISKVLASRFTRQLMNERLDVVLYGLEVSSRLPGTDKAYRQLADRMNKRLRDAGARDPPPRKKVATSTATACQPHLAPPALAIGAKWPRSVRDPLASCRAGVLPIAPRKKRSRSTRSGSHLSVPSSVLTIAASGRCAA
jgi:hypothetical protein